MQHQLAANRPVASHSRSLRLTDSRGPEVVLARSSPSGGDKAAQGENCTRSYRISVFHRCPDRTIDVLSRLTAPSDVLTSFRIRRSTHSGICDPVVLAGCG